MSSYYLIIYDIREERRLMKVAEAMEQYGLRVQKSVFEAVLSPKALNDLKFVLLQILDPRVDGVKFFRLCERCHQRTNLFGKGEQPDLLEPWKVI